MHISYNVSTGGRWSDSFTYSNGNMVKSYFSLGSDNSSTPYTTSEYDYNGHALTASRYYLGSELIVHSAYLVDSLGRITSLTQYADNTSIQSTPTSTYLFKYDTNSNLVDLTDPKGTVHYYFQNYDTHPNPWYQLPFDFAYNVTQYNLNVFSANNNQLSIVAAPNSVNFTQSISLTYSPDNKLAGITTPNTNGGGLYQAIQYQCK